MVKVILLPVLRLTQRLPAWLRMPVVGGVILFILLGVDVLLLAIRGKVPSGQAVPAAMLPFMGLGAGLATGMVVFALWRALRSCGRLGYCLTGAGALIVYMFTITMLIELTGSHKVLPDSTGSWLLFVLYPAALGMIGGWVAYPGPVSSAPSAADRER